MKDTDRNGYIFWKFFAMMQSVAGASIVGLASARVQADDNISLGSAIGYLIGVFLVLGNAIPFQWAEDLRGKILMSDKKISLS